MRSREWGSQPCFARFADYFVAALAEGTEVTTVESLDAEGARLRRVSADSGALCEPGGPRYAAQRR